MFPCKFPEGDKFPGVARQLLIDNDLRAPRAQASRSRAAFQTFEFSKNKPQQCRIEPTRSRGQFHQLFLAIVEHRYVKQKLDVRLCPSAMRDRCHAEVQG
jgi:hypothetical protein